MITKTQKEGSMEKSLTYESDEVLLEFLKKGDSAAFEFLYRQYYRMVAKQANDRGLQDSDAHDVFQEVLIVLVRKIHDPAFELSAKLGTFLFAIARNLLLKRSAKLSIMPPAGAMPSPADVQPAETDAEDLEAQLNAVVKTLDLLEPECRTLLLLSFYEKRSHAEIAAEMGYTEAFVKVKKHRCLNYLRKHVKQHPIFKDD